MSYAYKTAIVVPMSGELVPLGRNCASRVICSAEMIKWENAQSREADETIVPVSVTVSKGF